MFFWYYLWSWLSQTSLLHLYIQSENLSNESLSIISKIDSMGGTIKAIESGWIQNEIAKSAYDYQLKVDAGENIIVGVNKFETEETISPDLHEISSNLVQKQINKVKHFKSNRDNQSVNQAKSSLILACKGTQYLIPEILNCVKCECTLGEITEAMKSVFGEYQSN